MQRSTAMVVLGVLLMLMPAGAAASQGEGTRHITGSGMDLFFMDDKVFGTAGGHPLWAIYNCGSDIAGKIDIGGAYRDLNFTYHREGEDLITGTFGDLKLSMGRIEKVPGGLVYPVAAAGTVYRFTIRYAKQEDGHLVNSIIEGAVGGKNPLRLTVDGRLCPFATTGIIMIAVGAALSAN